jgi:16S rRNA (guanine1207-N2)-methyltransferase
VGWDDASVAGDEGHYFDQRPTVPSAPRQVTLALADATIRFTTDRGTFSHGAVDAGTKLLLLKAPPPPATGNLLDLGCGAGPIALTLARRSPGATVWAVDVNERAVERCRSNAAELGLTNVRATSPDRVPPTVRFDAIWSNPPIRIGKAALHDLLAHWLGRLEPHGEAWLVVQRHLGADSLARWLADHTWTVERRASAQGYRILHVTP